jgi:K+-sensing histidine kinase KdpD
VDETVDRWLSGLVVSAAAVTAVSALVALLEPHVPVLSLPVLYILVVLPVAAVWGTVLAAVASLLSTVAFAYLFLPPIHTLRVSESQNAVALGVFLVAAVVMGELAARSRREALEAARLSEEQSALRRVATLVTRQSPPAQVFEAVARGDRAALRRRPGPHGALRAGRDRDRGGRLGAGAGRAGRGDPV